MPSTSTRSSFSRTAAQACPVRAVVNQSTTSTHSTRKPRASQYRYGALTTPDRNAGNADRFSDKPSSPPVSPPGLRAAVIATAWANARVTIANAIPLTRNAIAPTTRGRAIAPASTISTARPSEAPQVPRAIAARYAPVPTNRAWPKDSNPVRPNITS